MGSLPAALLFLDRCGRPDAGLVLDLLHLMRSAGSLDVLDLVDAFRVGAVQLCDGPETYEGDLLEEAGQNRGVPGTGHFPCREFLAWLPEDAIVGVEVPRSLARDTRTLDERASELRDATLALYS